MRSTATAVLALCLPAALGPPGRPPAAAAATQANELARARAAYERSVTELAEAMLAELARRAEDEKTSDERDALRERGEWPPSLRRREWTSRWKGARAERAAAYEREAARAAERGEEALAEALALDGERDASCSDLAPWRDASGLVAESGAPRPWVRIGEAFLGSFLERSGEDHPPLVAQGELDAGTGGYALELVLSRIHGEGGLELAFAGLDGTSVACRLSGELLEAGEAARVFDAEGVRVVAIVQPGSVRVELEASTVARSASDGEAAGGAGTRSLLALRPDRDVQLKVSLRWKPLTLLEDERAKPRASAPDPEPVEEQPVARAKRAPIRGADDSVRAALEWLAAHQLEDGSWDCDGFRAACVPGDGSSCDGYGELTHDVGVAGLALLAFLRTGAIPGEGEHGEVVARGVAWLRTSQDEASGLLGTMLGHTFMYDHAIGTLALCEACERSPTPELRAVAQKAVLYLQRARNPQAGWRYDVPPLGESDTSLTGWALAALKAAEHAGLAVDSQAFAGGLRFIDTMTDPTTGRVGYDQRSGVSARVPNVNDQFTTENGEAMTAVGLYCRLMLGQGRDRDGTLAKHAELLLKKPPRWDVEEQTIDEYYWYYATLALRRMGGPSWSKWKKTLQEALLRGQDRDMKACAFGSWPPNGPWGFSCGRVGSTGLNCMALSADSWAAAKPR